MTVIVYDLWLQLLSLIHMHFLLVVTGNSVKDSMHVHILVTNYFDNFTKNSWLMETDGLLRSYISMLKWIM